MKLVGNFQQIMKIHKMLKFEMWAPQMFWVWLLSMSALLRPGQLSVLKWLNYYREKSCKNIKSSKQIWTKCKLKIFHIKTMNCWKSNVIFNNLHPLIVFTFMKPASFVALLITIPTCHIEYCNTITF